MPRRYGKAKRARLKALQASVRAGLADSAAGRYTNFNSSESLSKHLKSLAAKAMLEQREKQETNWVVLRRVTKPISDQAMQAYCEKRWPHIYQARTKVDDKND